MTKLLYTTILYKRGCKRAVPPLNYVGITRLPGARDHSVGRFTNEPVAPGFHTLVVALPILKKDSAQGMRISTIQRIIDDSQCVFSD